MRTLGIFLLFTLLLHTGCRKTHIIGEKKMEAVLYDIHLANALIDNEVQKREQLTDSLRNSLYATIFKKHRITSAQFDSSINWYGERLDKYLRIYKNLSERLSEEYNYYNQLIIAIENKIDTTELWHEKKQLLFVDEMFPMLLSFNDTIADNVRNNDTFTLSFRVFGINSQMNYYPRVIFTLHYPDTTDTKQLTLLGDSLYALTLPVINEKKPAEFSGHFYVRTHNNYFYRILFDDISIEHISPPVK